LLRRVLVDLARSRGADKRGGGAVRVTFDEAAMGGVAPDADVIRLDDENRSTRLGVCPGVAAAGIDPRGWT
jgi:hypothetical protein